MTGFHVIFLENIDWNISLPGDILTVIVLFNCGSTLQILLWRVNYKGIAGDLLQAQDCPDKVGTHFKEMLSANMNPLEVE